jgi:hypothetical protein
MSTDPTRHPLVCYAGTAVPDELWQRVTRLLTPALAFAGTHHCEDVRAAVEAGRSQLWLTSDGLAAVVTEIAVYPRVKALNILWVGGSALAGSRLSLAAAELMTQLDSFGRALGCTRIEACGRLGWARVMGRAGWLSRGYYSKRIG